MHAAYNLAGTRQRAAAVIWRENLVMMVVGCADLYRSDKLRLFYKHENLKFQQISYFATDR